MTKTSKKGLQRLGAIASAAAIASLMAVPMAWAAEIPGTEGDSGWTGDSTTEGPANIDTNIHLIVLDDDTDDTNVISVTAPTDIYMAAKVSGDPEVVDFITPTAGAAKIQNLSNNKTKVASWTVQAGEGLAKKAADADSAGFWKHDATDANMSAGKLSDSTVSNSIKTTQKDSYWLQANGADIAVAGTASADGWSMLAKSPNSVGDHIDLDLKGQMLTPTKAYYEDNPVIDKVTWTFALVS